MRLIRLEVDGYRNLRNQRLEFPPEGVAIVGANAQGKTNLLEAIHYLETFRSFRSAPDEQLVHFGDDTFRIEGTIGRDPVSQGVVTGSADTAPAVPVERPPGPDRTVSAAYSAGTREKRIRIDGELAPYC